MHAAEGSTVSGLILVVDSDVETARSLSAALESRGYQVTIAETGSAARSTIEHVRPDLIMLDLLLPDTDGLVLTATLKTLTNAPIIICSARHKHVDKVLSLNVGAADFIDKPFRLDELGARIEAVLRRVRKVPSAPLDQIRVDELHISQARGTVALAGQHVHLTRTEYRLLVALAGRANKVLSREALGQLVWGYQDLGTCQLIDVLIGRLRLKLRHASDSGPVIVTVLGEGFTMSAQSSKLLGAEDGDGSLRGGLQPELSSSAGRPAVSRYGVSGALFGRRFGASCATADQRRNGTVIPAH